MAEEEIFQVLANALRADFRGTTNCVTLLVFEIMFESDNESMAQTGQIIQANQRHELED